jgi:hypothetical protein
MKSLVNLKNSDTISQLNINDIPESDPSKIGTKLSNNALNVDKQPEDYINYGRIPLEMVLSNTTPEHVVKIIQKSNNKFSKDIFGVSSKMNKFIGAEIAIPPAHIFNLSLEGGSFPTMLKQCRVIPIFKSGNRLDSDNYRPISLLSSISKVLEKIVSEKLLH